MQLSVKDAASILNLPEKTIYRWVKEESIPFHQVNDEVRFNRVELLEWATSRRLEISPEIFRESEDAGRGLPSLTEALEAGGIAYGVKGRSPDQVLRSVVDLLRLPGEVDRDFLYQVLLAREGLGSTGIGNGIAIPHVRNPVVLHVEKPTVTLCFLEEAIDFQALDGKPVSILFTLICPSVPAHLHLLSRLGFVLRSEELKSALAARAPSQELMAILSGAEAGLPSSQDKTGPRT